MPKKKLSFAFGLDQSWCGTNMKDEGKGSCLIQTPEIIFPMTALYVLYMLMHIYTNGDLTSHYYPYQIHVVDFAHTTVVEKWSSHC